MKKREILFWCNVLGAIIGLVGGIVISPVFDLEYIPLVIGFTIGGFFLGCITALHDVK